MTTLAKTHSTVRALSALTLLAAALAGCVPSRDAGPELVELCRPDTVPDKPLRIGTLEVSPGTFDARLSVNDTYNEYGVHIALNQVDAQRLATLTRSTLNQRLPLRIGDVVISEPIVRTPILDGRILISGSFTRMGAEDVVRQISPPCLRLATSEEAAEPEAAAAGSGRE
ncbi:MAG: hypothetical protein AAF253_11900 [Pseudomonadota bacterium]